MWEAQERVRHAAPEKWLGYMAPYFQRGECVPTAEAGAVEILERIEPDDGHAVLVVMLPGRRGTWFLSPEGVP